ncbi:type II secretion system protein [Vibrio fluminensis]|uniref:type II secretion system protein n=1 Tax=Vibrio fluminensis TaxID=2783614 RepID=UPI0018892333|nr:type II secretion system protein [Vibrio fluminensis]
MRNIRIRAHGFTLIELVVVVTILGVISITAMSVYQSFRKDAKITALLGAKDALATVNTEVYTKAVLQGVEDEVALTKFNIDLNNDGVRDVMGYYGLIKYVSAANELAGLDPKFHIAMWSNKPSATTPYFFIGYKVDGSTHLSKNIKCYVQVYYPEDSSGAVNYKLVSEDC